MNLYNNSINLCGVKISSISLEETLSQVDQWVQSRTLSYIVTPNVDHLVKLRGDAEFRRIYETASLVLPDGMPVLWAAGFLGTPLKEKISGSDLFLEICSIAVERGYKLFFLGGRPSAAYGTAEALRKKHPNINIAGVRCPPLGFEKDKEENSNIVDMIKKANPDILFVGLGSPKQEKWIYAHRYEYQAPVSIGIGGSFEFVSGMVKRAPKWMQRIGLEWLWRIMMEPGRLWKRYLIDDMPFFWLVLKQKMGRV